MVLDQNQTCLGNVRQNLGEKLYSQPIFSTGFGGVRQHHCQWRGGQSQVSKFKICFKMWPTSRSMHERFCFTISCGAGRILPIRPEWSSEWRLIFLDSIFAVCWKAFGRGSWVAAVTETVWFYRIDFITRNCGKVIVGKRLSGKPLDMLPIAHSPQITCSFTKLVGQFQSHTLVAPYTWQDI